MSVNNEEEQIDVEHVLYDVMDIVCKYVDEEDLSNMYEVCKSWRKSVIRHKNKRHYGELLVFNYEKKNLAKLLRTNPYVSIIIFDSIMERLVYSCYQNSTVAKILKNFKNELPKEAIVIRVDVFHTSHVPDVSESDYTEMLGIFLPSVKHHICVHVAELDTNNLRLNYDCKSDELALLHIIDQFAEELGLNDCKHSESTIIQLVKSNSVYETEIIEKLGKRAQQSDKKIIFANVGGTQLVSQKSYPDENKKSIIWLRISGSKIESWSTFIHSYASVDEIMCKLYELEKKIKRKRHYNGLIYSPTCCKLTCTQDDSDFSINNFEMMGLIHVIFPDIQFMGFFTDNCNYRDFESMGFNNNFDENDPFKPEFLKEYDKYTSVLIISYD